MTLQIGMVLLVSIFNIFIVVLVNKTSPSQMNLIETLTYIVRLGYCESAAFRNQ